jgi:hypothetical protein
VQISPDRALVLHHGQIHEDLDHWIADTHPDLRHWVLITAWNPHGRVASEEANRKANEQLEDELHQRGWPFVDAVGELKDWKEESVLALIPSREDGLELGVRYHQEAVLVGCRGELAEVVVSRQPTR